LDGICGTGKSSIALHCCKNFGKSIIVVPTKHLQDQYHNDYSKEMSVHSMKIRFLKGRGNFKCKYEDNKLDCNYPSLPCIAHLGSGEKRHEKCKCNYWSPIYKTEVARKILSDRQKLTNIELKEYKTCDGTKCQIVRDPACGYYKQYFSFWDDTNVIVMNDRIWSSCSTRSLTPSWRS
jgi:hypothetical protein